MSQVSLKPEAIKYLVVHCSATQAKSDIGAKEIDRMHRAQGWQMIGYHFVIRRNGALETGRPTNMIGAHVQGYNSESLGICMVGGVDPTGKAEDNFTPAQYASLSYLLQDLSQQYPKATIQGHRDFPGVKKDCPCFDVRSWWKEPAQGESDES